MSKRLTKNEAAMVSAAIRNKADQDGLKLSEWVLCNLLWVVDERQSPPKEVKFEPNPVQWSFLRNMHYLSIVLKARQHGISTLIAMLITYFCLFKTNYRAAIIDRTDDEAKKKLAKIRFAYEHLDDERDPAMAGLGYRMKQELQLIPPTGDHVLTWQNGSSVYAATSARGGTCNFLWVSEFGKIARDDPGKAREITAGSLEAVHPGNIAVIESTHEGGRYGENFRMIRLAQQSPPEPEQMQWKLLFFPWFENPSYAVPLRDGEQLVVPPMVGEYFNRLESSAGMTLSEEQKKWYVLKESGQPDMAHQYPGTVEEALQSVAEGAIYADRIARLRSEGRVCPLVCDTISPMWTFWDLGMSDATGIWLLQLVGFDVHALDFHCANGASPAEHAAVLLGWERKYNKRISGHYLPHDADNRGPAGKTWFDLLHEAGLQNLKKVPRTPDIWVGINYLRTLLSRFRFNADTCEKDFPMPIGKTIWPSGLAGLEGYRKKTEAVGGNIRDLPVHDECESSASALRTFAEAHKRGMLVGNSPMEVQQRRSVMQPERALMGLSTGQTW